MQPLHRGHHGGVGRVGERVEDVAHADFRAPRPHRLEHAQLERAEDGGQTGGAAEHCQKCSTEGGGARSEEGGWRVEDRLRIAAIFNYPPRVDLSPMLATLADAPLQSKLLVYEPKYDGIRAIAEIQAPRRGQEPIVRLWSRNGNEKTTQFPAIAAALAAAAGGIS